MSSSFLWNRLVATAACERERFPPRIWSALCAVAYRRDAGPHRRGRRHLDGALHDVLPATSHRTLPNGYLADWCGSSVAWSTAIPSRPGSGHLLTDPTTDIALSRSASPPARVRGSWDSLPCTPRRPPSGLRSNGQPPTHDTGHRRPTGRLIADPCRPNEISKETIALIAHDSRKWELMQFRRRSSSACRCSGEGGDRHDRGLLNGENSPISSPNRPHFSQDFLTLVGRLRDFAEERERRWTDGGDAALIGACRNRRGDPRCTCPVISSNTPCCRAQHKPIFNCWNGPP
jgi:hypothetical protein